MTIKKLAEMAGVSKGTVSRVLNGQKGVGAATRKRIQSLMKKTGYTPKAAARQLATQRSGIICAAMPADFGTSGFYWSGMISALTRAARLKGYILTVNPMENAASRDDLLTLAQSKSADGFILFGDLMDGKIAEDLTGMKIPFSIIGEPETGKYSCVTIDNREGGRMLGTALIEEGAREILLLAGPKYKKSVQERIAGFKESLTGANISTLKIIHLEYEESSFRKIERLLENHGFDGIAVSSGDFVLPVVLNLNWGRMACRTGFFDDNGILSLLEHSLNHCIVIHQDIPATASFAVDRVIQHIQNTGTDMESCTVIPLQTRTIGSKKMRSNR